MSCRTVPEKVSDFLVKCSGRKYCDSCIQERLGLKWRQQVQLITATLAVTPLFEREQGTCCTCNEVKQVTCAKGGAATVSIGFGRSVVLAGESAHATAGQGSSRKLTSFASNGS
jgi:hypothetical protein